MTYSGKLYGKHGRTYFPLILTAKEVDKIEAQRDDLSLALKNLIVAVTARMGADEPTALERLALYTAHKEASNLLADILEP